MVISVKDVKNFTNEQLQEKYQSLLQSKTNVQSQIADASKANRPSLFDLTPNLSTTTKAGTPDSYNSTETVQSKQGSVTTDSSSDETGWEGLEARDSLDYDGSVVTAPGAKYLSIGWQELLKKRSCKALLQMPLAYQKEKIKAHAVLIKNVLDPMRRSGESWANFTLSSAWRPGQPGSPSYQKGCEFASDNHANGYTVDIHIPDGVLDTYIAMGMWIAENCSVKQIFLEGHPRSGGVHLHVMANAPGVKQRPLILTYPDATKNKKEPGFDANAIRQARK